MSVIRLFRRVITTKRGTVEIPDDAEGTPIEDVLPAPIPASLKGALVYEIDGRRIIARQDLTPQNADKR